MSRPKFVLTVLVALVPTLVLFLGVWGDARLTDREIASSAPEDILGFGFWLTWLVLLLVEGPALVLRFTFGEGTVQRRFAACLVGAFVVATAAAYASYLHVYARVVG